MPLNWISIGIKKCCEKLNSRDDIPFGGEREEQLWKDLMILVNKYYPGYYKETTLNATRAEIENAEY